MDHPQTLGRREGPRPQPRRLVRRVPQRQRAKISWVCERAAAPRPRHRSETRHPPYVHIPWETKSGDVDFGPEAANKTLDQQIRFFDYWLKSRSNGVDKDPAVRVFVMGANTWREAENWPIPGARSTNYYLRSQGQANSMYGNGQLPTGSRLRRRAARPLCLRSGQPRPQQRWPLVLFHTVAPVGPYDQSDVEKRADVLVYSTAPLTEAVEVTGPISVTLYAASSAADTDWTAKLVDVHPDGKVINLNNGIIRASHRNSLEASEPIEAGKVYEYTITVFPTATSSRRATRSGWRSQAATSPTTTAT